MSKRTILKSGVAAIALATALCGTALAGDFNIPAGDLRAALATYTRQTGVTILYASDDMQGTRSRGVKGSLSPDEALSRILSGTGFEMRREGTGIEIIRNASQSESTPEIAPFQLAQAAPARSAVETVTVTSSKLGGADVQSIPIAITALSQEQLTATQTAGGPDLVKQVPNLTFTKTNFSGYSITIRGIGTQAISVSTDPAVAVALNDMPFIRNHFFEQEFYDVSQAEVLRGPQGTLYGRNATAGVVNLISAKPTDQFEAMASADVGNYQNRRFEGMVNLPIVDDRLDLRIAGEWTKRNGYSFNALTDSPIDGRDLWSGRVTLAFHPTEKFKAYLVWEHFQENDDRLRSAKQLCKRDNGLTQVNGVATNKGSGGTQYGKIMLSQVCSPVSLYSPEAFQVPNSLALAYYGGITGAGFGLGIASPLIGGNDAYASVSQSRDLRVIESSLDPNYKAKNDVLELHSEYAVSPSLTFTSETGYNQDFLYSTEDFNRFNTQPGIFSTGPTGNANLLVTQPDGNYACADGTVSIGTMCAGGGGTPTGYFCDPQLGCSDRLVAEDLNDEHSWQLNQEFRLASNFSGPLNFSVGGNFMHYETEENYYVFFNTITMWSAARLGNGATHTVVPWNPSDSSQQCVSNLTYPNPADPGSVGNLSCVGWIDHGTLETLDNKGHNYFLSQNPYLLNSYAGFGEIYYNVVNDLKLTGGLRWTDDHKHFVDIPSEFLTAGTGYPVTGVVDQEWREWTGRFAANWTPKVAFTDQTLVYASFAHGYKGGGANPPGALFAPYSGGSVASVAHPLTFAPEFINAYELGTKNTLLDGALTFNGDVFYYDYKGYQISEIIDRTALNLNFDATVRGAEIEATYEPVPGLKFHFAGGYEHTRIADVQDALDLMDRLQGHDGWVLAKPFPDQASNCVLPAYVVAWQLSHNTPVNFPLAGDCGYAYSQHDDPVTGQTYTANPAHALPYSSLGGPTSGLPIPPGSYPGFDPLAGTPNDPYTGQNTNNGIDYGPAPNNGAGWTKDVSGNQLPNAPPFTVSFSAEYSLPVTPDWAATIRGDYYWQDYSWARVFNDNPYDRLRGYTSVNAALILTNQNGWQVMGYVKNVFNTTAITGAFLNSDDSGLTTNVFLTDPRLFGVRITKNW